MNGAASGALTGAVSGAIAGGISSTIKVAQAVGNWGETAFKTPFQNMTSHFQKHVINEGHKYLGSNIINYTNNAKNFFDVNKEIMKLTSSGNFVIRGFLLEIK